MFKEGKIEGLYLRNLKSAVLKYSDSSNWNTAVYECEIYDVDEDDTLSESCVCGKETVRVPYLLTRKLFCGHCGTEMVVADGGTSKMSAQHNCYICKKRRCGKCDKKRENKDNLELYVTARERIFD